MDREIVLRNVVEVVTEEELSSLLSEKKKQVVYCGFEVSGPVHVGTLVTATKLLDFQSQGFLVKVLLADVHTRLNRKNVDIDAMVSYWRETFKAFGLTKAEYVLGSSFQFKEEYVRDVLELGLKSTLQRALRSMQEVARDIENAHVSQVIYPLMQIADIKALGVDVAYGGLEQRKIHMLARETLPEIGYKKPVCVHTPLIPSLKGPSVKMSSSIPESMIAAEESPESIKSKINSAFCPPEKNGNPILSITELVLFPRLGKLEVKRPQKFGGNMEYDSYKKLEGDFLAKKLHPQDLKNTTADSLITLLEPVRRASTSA
jgi:tyrosyl-tRNA synthetase